MVAAAGIANCCRGCKRLSRHLRHTFTIPVWWWGEVKRMVFCFDRVSPKYSKYALKYRLCNLGKVSTLNFYPGFASMMILFHPNSSKSPVWLAACPLPVLPSNAPSSILKPPLKPQKKFSIAYKASKSMDTNLGFFGFRVRMKSALVTKLAFVEASAGLSDRPMLWFASLKTAGKFSNQLSLPSSPEASSVEL